MAGIGFHIGGAPRRRGERGGFARGGGGLTVGGYPGRIGSLGAMNLIGAPLPGMPAGFPLPALGAVQRPPGLMGFGAPAPGPMALGGPIPGMQMQPAAAQDAYSLVLPVPPALAIAAGASATLTMTPQRPMRIERLTTAVATGVWLITSFLAGVDNQFVASGAVDAGLFAPTAFGVALRGSTVYPGITVTIVIQNNTGAAASTAGWAIIGTAVA